MKGETFPINLHVLASVKWDKVIWEFLKKIFIFYFGTKETFHNSAAYARNIDSGFSQLESKKTLTLCAGLLLFCIINHRRSNI